MSDVVVSLSYGDARAEITVPIRADGALPFMLTEVVEEAVRAFVAVYAAEAPSGE